MPFAKKRHVLNDARSCVLQHRQKYAKQHTSNKTLCCNTQRRVLRLDANEVDGDAGEDGEGRKREMRRRREHDGRRNEIGIAARCGLRQSCHSSKSGREPGLIRELISVGRCKTPSLCQDIASHESSGWDEDCGWSRTQ